MSSSGHKAGSSPGSGSSGGMCFSTSSASASSRGRNCAHGLVTGCPAEPWKSRGEVLCAHPFIAVGGDSSGVPLGGSGSLLGRLRL